MNDFEDIVRQIQDGDVDAFMIGYLRPDGVTQVGLGGELDDRNKQKVAFKMLFAYALRSAAGKYDEDDAKFVGDGLRWLDSNAAILEALVDEGLLPDHVVDNLPDDSDPQSPADALADMIADANPDLPGWDDGSDDDSDDEPGGVNIPIN